MDDDQDAREACRLILHSGHVLSRPYATAKDAVNSATRGDLPGLVLMDMSLPGECAGAAIQAILGARPSTLVVALTSHQRADLVFEALRAGAVGYVLKQRAEEELLTALDTVEAGGSPLSASVARCVLAAFREEGARFEPLSERERDILHCFSSGKSYSETAEALDIAIDTVRTHVRRLYSKLRVRTRSEAVLAALKRGMLR